MSIRSRFYPAVLLLLSAPLAFAGSPIVRLAPATPTVVSGFPLQFFATVLNLNPSTVTWSVNGVTGGSPSTGTISGTGQYIPPAVVTMPSVTVQVTSTANPSMFATATVTLYNLPPAFTVVSPGTINTGYFTSTVTGSNFLPGMTATFGSTPLMVQYTSSTTVQIAGTVNAQPGAILPLTFTNPFGGPYNCSYSFVVQPPISVSVTPSNANLMGGATQTVYATVSNTSNRAVNWLVNGIPGGNSTVGTVVASPSVFNEATYTAPVVPPPAGTVTLQAQSQQNPNVLSPASVFTLGNPVPTVSGVSPSPVPYGNFSITVTGTNFVQGAQITFGAQTLPTQFISSTLLTAQGTIGPTLGQMAMITVTNPGVASSNGVTVNLVRANAQVSYPTAFHLLEQATWGPTPNDIDHLQQVGLPQWFNEQLNAPLSVYNQNPASLSTTQSDFFVASLTGQDQLRQRVAFALAQIFCISAIKDSTPQQIVPYLQLLESDAFANFSQLLQDVTLSPSMGRYLDMADNYAAESGNPAPNQNYAREVLQLFSIGTVMLNADGSTQVDGSGNPIPTYNQTTIENFARIFTGWTYPVAPGATMQPINPNYFTGPMVAWEAYHDDNPKTLLNGFTTLAGQTAEQDLASALSNIFNHPNVGPFIALRLIQHLVESNPSPAYIQRIASVFNDDGTGTRGNLWAVVQAILTDPEARASDDPNTWPVNGGHLREPVLFLNAVLRESNAAAASSNSFSSVVYQLGQNLLYPETVFSYYSPTWMLPGNSGLDGPEFYLMNSATGLATLNWIYDVSTGQPGIGATVDLSPFQQFATNPQALVSALSNALLAGQMPAAQQSAIVTALSAVPPGYPQIAVQNAFYLTAGTPIYMVQR